jgi:hypothetical protein
MDRGYLGGLNYEIPLNQQSGQQAMVAPKQGGQVNANALVPPMENDPLAVREKKTDDYYNNYALLKNFVADAQSKGINPFEPDYSQPGGGLAFRTYQKLQAGLMYASNALKNEFETEQDFNKLKWQNKAGLAPGVDLRRDMLTENPDAVVSYEPTHQVEEANRRLNTPTYRKSDADDFNAAYKTPTEKDIDDQVKSGQLAPAQAEILKSQLFPNVPQVSYQQLIPRGDSGRGLSAEDISKRAELIKQVKRGILTKDQTPLNVLRIAPGVSDVQYVDDGDRIGINVVPKSGEPTFIDLSQGSGEGEINALLNRIEGQLNVPNEQVFAFDTKVDLPASNSKVIVADLKTKIKAIPGDAQAASDIFPKLQELAAQGKLKFGGGTVMSMYIKEPMFYGDNSVEIKYHPVSKSGTVDYSKTKTKIVSDPLQLEALITENANTLVPNFGGQVQSESAQRAQDLINKYRSK